MPKFMPIVMSKDEWSRIKKWTDMDNEDSEVARKREYVKYLDAASRQMTKSWPNSVENVNRRNEELRQARIDAAEQANTKFYKRYLKRKKEEQQRLMYSARDAVFKNRDAPKLLLSAVIETAIQKEREEQVKFLKERRREVAAQKKKEEDEVVIKAKEWNQLMALKKKRRFEINKQHQKDIIEQANEVAERNRLEYEQELNFQKIDNIVASQQIQALKEFDENFKKSEKARICSDMSLARSEREAARRERAARDRVDDKLIAVLLRSRDRIQQQRKHTEQHMQNEKLRILEAISQRLESGDAAREAKDNENMEKASRQREQADEGIRQARREKAALIQRELEESRLQHLAEEERRLHEFNTLRQWDVMNRFKNAEIYEEFKENVRLEKEQKVKEYREEILRLWKEREDREARELADTRHFYGELAEQKMREDDNRLLTHAALLLDEAKRLGRPDHALHRAIDAYCKQNRLYPMPSLPASLQQHFPQHVARDPSRPDPHYTPPSPPAHSAHPGDGEDQGGQRKRDGLQAVAKASTSKPKEKKEEQPADYKRSGKANGLQRRNLEITLSLPPITVVPCKTESCRCELKADK